MHGILTNVIYTGTVDQKGSLYPGEHERIIDQNTWDRTHETLRRNNGDNGASLLPCGTTMMHTYTMRKSKRYRYYVCYNAQQQGWKNCETKSVPAQAIESAVLDSIRRIGTDPKLAEAVATEALNQVARRRQEIDKESESQRRSVRQLNQDLAREAADTSVDSGARFERMGTLQREIETMERRFAELTSERHDLDREQINAHDLRRTLAEFDAIWSSLSTKEQEQMLHLPVAKVGYDGRTGKVAVNFSNTGAKELCQGKC
jgi:site-specific DNA recombinase